MNDTNTTNVERIKAELGEARSKRTLWLIAFVLLFPLTGIPLFGTGVVQMIAYYSLVSSSSRHLYSQHGGQQVEFLLIAWVIAGAVVLLLGFASGVKAYKHNKRCRYLMEEL